MISTVVFLQNAWSGAYAGRYWPRESWLEALGNSRSGQRLRTMIDDLDCCENVTREVGMTPSSILPANPLWINAVLIQRKPEQVVTCGFTALMAVRRIWPGPLLAVPHPAYRVLTNSLYTRARQLLELGLSGRKQLRQTRAGPRLINVEE